MHLCFLGFFLANIFLVSLVSSQFTNLNEDHENDDGWFDSGMDAFGQVVRNYMGYQLLSNMLGANNRPRYWYYYQEPYYVYPQHQQTTAQQTGYWSYPNQYQRPRPYSVTRQTSRPRRPWTQDHGSTRPNVWQRDTYVLWKPFNNQMVTYRLKFVPTSEHGSTHEDRNPQSPTNLHRCPSWAAGHTEYLCYDLRNAGLTQGEQYKMEVSYYMHGDPENIWTPWTTVTNIIYQSTVQRQYIECRRGQSCWNSRNTGPACTCGAGTTCRFNTRSRNDKYCLPNREYE